MVLAVNSQTTFPRNAENIDTSASGGFVTASPAVGTVTTTFIDFDPQFGTFLNSTDEFKFQKFSPTTEKGTFTWIGVGQSSSATYKINTFSLLDIFEEITVNSYETGIKTFKKRDGLVADGAIFFPEYSNLLITFDGNFGSDSESGKLGLNISDKADNIATQESGVKFVSTFTRSTTTIVNDEFETTHTTSSITPYSAKRGGFGLVNTSFFREQNLFTLVSNKKLSRNDDIVLAYIDTINSSIYNNCFIDWGGASSNFADDVYKGDFSKVRGASNNDFADTYMPVVYPRKVVREGAKISFKDLSDEISATIGSNTFTGSFNFNNDNGANEFKFDLAQETTGYEGNFVSSNPNYSKITEAYKFLGKSESCVFVGKLGCLKEKYHGKHTSYSFSEQNEVEGQSRTNINCNNVTSSTAQASSKEDITQNFNTNEPILELFFKTNWGGTSTKIGLGNVKDKWFYEFPIGRLKGNEPQFNV